MIRFIKFLIQKLVDYINTSKNKFKYDIVQVIMTFAIFPINYLIFHFIFHSNFILGIAAFSVGCGGLLTAWIMERNNCDFPDGGGINVVTRYISYSAIMAVTFGFMFMLIKKGYEDYSVTDRIKETSNKSAYTVSEKNETNASIGWENNRSLFPTTIYPVPPSQQQ